MSDITIGAFVALCFCIVVTLATLAYVSMNSDKGDRVGHGTFGVEITQK